MGRNARTMALGENKPTAPMRIATVSCETVGRCGAGNAHHHIVEERQGAMT